jgi:hypothetical protein
LLLCDTQPSAKKLFYPPKSTDIGIVPPEGSRQNVDLQEDNYAKKGQQGVFVKIGEKRLIEYWWLQRMVLTAGFMPT